MIVTLIYRFCLGLSMALLNEWVEGWVVYIFISGSFLTYIHYYKPFND